MQTKHLIFGTGLIGSYLAGCFHQNNNHVHLLGRDTSRASFKDGFKLSDFKKNSFETNEQLEFIKPSSSNTFDIVWLTVKCTSIASVIEPMNSLLVPSSTIICCQNGFGSEQIIKDAFPNNKVLCAVVGFNVAQVTYNHWHRSTEGALVIENTAETQNFDHLLQNELLPIRLSNDIEAERWSKLQLNLANAVNALSDIPIKEMLEKREYRLIIAQLMRELLLVTNARQLNLPKVSALHGKFIPLLMSLPNFIFKRVAQKMLTIDPQARTSMWHDLNNKRKTEIDFINGAVVSNAAQLGISSPLNNAVISLIKSVENNKESVGLTPEQLKDKLKF